MAARKKAPAPPPPPRSDGLLEVRTTWQKIGIGHVIWAAGRKWAVIEARQPDQYQYGKTCWFKVQAPQGETHIIPPKLKRDHVTILVEPGAAHIPPAYADGGVEEALLEEILGANEIATKDHASGEIWCPWRPGEPGNYLAPQILHLQIGHGMDTTGIEDYDQASSIHGKAHDVRWPHIGKGGFPHRHVPEELEYT